ncbi:hypothetical protein C365_02345 [Cryptococcus neoformans Bt85]|nr:hypothetical protein C365_02345 [Cryptococcus neoformans var. grubii Bt85]
MLHSILCSSDGPFKQRRSCFGNTFPVPAFELSQCVFFFPCCHYLSRRVYIYLRKSFSLVSKCLHIRHLSLHSSIQYGGHDHPRSRCHWKARRSGHGHPSQ